MSDNVEVSCLKKHVKRMPSGRYEAVWLGKVVTASTPSGTYDIHVNTVRVEPRRCVVVADDDGSVFIEESRPTLEEVTKAVNTLVDAVGCSGERNGNPFVIEFGNGIVARDGQGHFLAGGTNNVIKQIVSLGNTAPQE